MVEGMPNYTPQPVPALASVVVFDGFGWIARRSALHFPTPSQITNVHTAQTGHNSTVIRPHCLLVGSDDPTCQVNRNFFFLSLFPKETT